MAIEVTPALFDHCETVYTEMKERAKKVERDGQEVWIYEGFLTKLFEELRLSTPYYSSVMSELSNLDCVRQLRRGGGSTPSQWAMIQRPTRTLWNSKKEHRTAAYKYRKDEIVAQRLRDMQKSIDALFDFTGAPRPL